MAFLLPNLKNKNNILMFISTSFMTKIIRSVSKKQNDEDYISHYINFLKYLSSHLDKVSFYFFYHKETFSFPLLDSCIILYNHIDPLVKNVSRHILLTILKLQNVDCLHYLCSMPYVSLFLLIIKQTKMNLKELITNQNKSEEERTTLLEEVQSDIIFMQDIFNIGIEKINYILTNIIFGELIIPCILHNLKKENTNYDKSTIYTIEILLYVLWLFFYHIKNTSFLNILCLLVFSDKIIKALTSEVELEIETDKIIEIFDKEIDENGTFEYFLMRNYSNSLIQSLSLDDYDEILLVHKNKEFYDFVKSIQTIKPYFKHNHSEFMNVLYTEIMNKLKTQQKNCSKIIRAHNIISKLSGLVVGMCDKNAYLYSAVLLMKKQFPLHNKAEGINNEVKLKFIDILCNTQLYSNNVITYLSLILFQIANKESGCIDEDLLIDLGLKRKIINSSQVIDINGFYDINSLDFDYSNVNINGSNNTETIKKDEVVNYVYFKGIIQKQEKSIHEFLLNSLAQNPFYFSQFTLNVIYHSLFDYPFEDEALKLMYLSKTFKEIIKNIKEELSNKARNSFVYRYALCIFRLELMEFQTDTTIHLKKLTSHPLFILDNLNNVIEQLQKQLIYPPYIQELYSYRTLLYHFFIHINQFNKALLYNIQNNAMIKYQVQNGCLIRKEDLRKDKINVFEVNVHKEENGAKNESVVLFFYNFNLCLAESKDEIYVVKYCYQIWNIETILVKGKNEIKINGVVDIKNMNKKDTISININDNERLGIMYQMIGTEISMGNDNQYLIIKNLFDGIN